MNLVTKIIILFIFLISFFNSQKIAFANDLIISGKVLSAPIKPIVIGEALCVENMLTIEIDWPTDENSEAFDIKRNGELLVTNLIDSHYSDIDAPTHISSSYQVIAHGPMHPGSAISDEIIVFTPNECLDTEPSFTQKITSLENKPIESYGSYPKIENRRPLFSGKTNLANAKIEISITGSSEIYQTIFTNNNGFWEWQIPETLNFGLHTLTATAIDPNDPSHTVTDKFSFEIFKRSETDSNESDNHHSSYSPTNNTHLPLVESGLADILSTSENSIFQIAVSVENFNRVVFFGEQLSLRIDFSHKSIALQDKDYQLFYEIIDEENNIIYVNSDPINIFRTNYITKKIPTSILTPTGKYHIRVKAYDGKILIAGENFFTIKEIPPINIGFCKISIIKIIQNYAWIAIFILIAFLSLLNKEHHHSEEGIYQVTETNLKKGSYFSKK